MIRVCIAGNSGHAATVTRALPRLPQVVLTLLNVQMGLFIQGGQTVCRNV